MRLFTLFLSVILAASPAVPAWAKGRKSVELALTGPRAYRLDGQEYDYAAVGARLAELDAETPIRKLVLVDPHGSGTIADVIDFALLAKPIGARPRRQELVWMHPEDSRFVWVRTFYFQANFSETPQVGG